MVLMLRVVYANSLVRRLGVVVGGRFECGALALHGGEVMFRRR